MFLIFVQDTIELLNSSLDVLITHLLLMFGQLVVSLLSSYWVSLFILENLELTN